MVERRHGVALVLGASVAGLLTATELSEHFERVVVLERDRLPDDATHRKGVPQGLHVHVLLRRGLEHLDRRFPGFEAELVAAGVPKVNLTRDLAYYAPEGRCPSFEGGLEVLLPSRILLEARLRDRVRALPRVEIRDEVAVTGLLCREGKVVGVTTAEGPPLEAALVVDCTGRGSKMPAWLEAAGLKPPPEQSIRSPVAYATRWYRLPPGTAQVPRAVALLPRPPEDLRVALLNPVENDRYTVTFCGAPPQDPPTDEAGFLAWATDLRAPEIAAFLAVAEPTSPIHSFRQMGNQRRFYERVPVAGLVVLGDAFCTLNPVYGQGMTVSALSAEQLGLRVAAHRGAFDVRFSEGVQRALAKVVAAPWLAATSQDYKVPGTQGSPPPLSLRVVDPYMGEFLGLMTRSPKAFEDFLRMAHMVASPVTVFKPGYVLGILGRVMRRWMGMGDPSPSPSGRGGPLAGHSAG